jgi:integrase
MASLRARHSRTCALGGIETKAPQSERERVAGCTCRPTYSIRGAAGKGHERVGRDLRAALRANRKRQVELDAGEFVPQQNIRFDTWAERWLRSLERKPSTVASYHSTLAYAADTFGTKHVRRVTPTDVAALSRRLRDDGLSDSTRAKHLRVLHACLASAVSHGYAAQNPVARIPTGEKPRPQKREAGYFESDELAPIANAVPDGTYRTALLLALQTGLRQGELVALTWADVDLGEQTLRVRRSVTAGVLSGTKSHEARTVDLSGDAADLLGRWWQAQTRDGWREHDALVFPAETGGFLRGDSLYYRLRQAMAKAGVPFRGPTGEPRGWHSLRHTYARLALERGASITWLQRQLGHSSITVTIDRYGHWERAAAKREASKLDGAFAY